MAAVLGGAMLTLLLLRPLTLMGLDDGVARNLGLALSLARLGGLSLAIIISALLVSAVGIIGFIGLFAPLLARCWALAAAIALAAGGPDWRAAPGGSPIRLSSGWPGCGWKISTGSVTALIGAPLLLWLLPRLRSISAPVMNGGDVLAERQHVLWFALGWRFSGAGHSRVAGLRPRRAGLAPG
ncbi:iron chelate uptake ABC transporter family permease subunit [Escherichia coli]